MRRNFRIMCFILTTISGLAFGNDGLEGYTLINPGVWEKVDENGVRFLHAEGIDGLEYRIAELEKNI